MTENDVRGDRIRRIPIHDYSKFIMNRPAPASTNGFRRKAIEELRKTLDYRELWQGEVGGWDVRLIWVSQHFI